MANVWSNYTFAYSGNTYSSSNTTDWQSWHVPPAAKDQPVLREKTAVEKLDDRINEVRSLVAA